MAGATQNALAALPSHGGIAPVRQSDRLAEFTAKARACDIVSASSGKECFNAAAQPRPGPVQQVT